MPADLSALLITFLVFGAVAIAVFVIGQFIAVQTRVRRRVAAHAADAEASPRLGLGFDALVSTYFDEKRFGIKDSVRAELRRELIRAGFFRADAINYYIFARMASVVVLTITGYLFVELFLADAEWYLKFGSVAIVILLAALGPDAYIARRKRKLHEDLLIMGAETRAGRGTIDALASLADRLGLEEAHSLVAILRQSIELGTDVGDGLRVFSDEMRDRRLLRAEERANELPVKMVLPLGLFIFPVILGLVMLPVMLRLATVLG